ncbi:MAG: FAD-dependent oxidoreductase, partial [Dehalococcoidia bacterium]
RAEGATTIHLRDAEGAESSLRAGVLVNAAGHGAPALAALAGLPLDGDPARGLPPLRQRVNRGRYYDLVTPEFSRAVSRPVYPIPSGDVQRHQAQAGGAGMHLSADIDGVAHLGPDTEWLPEGAPLDYRVDDAPRAAFLEAGRRFLSGLTDEDIAPGQVGYRPKIEVTGDTPPDFLIFRDGAYVHLGGIESPGLTSALAIARYVEGLV